jgi:hypothetical protein
MDCDMTSQRNTRPLFTIAAIAALAVGIAACNSGGSGAQSGYAPANSGYSSTGYDQGPGINPNDAGSIGAQNQAQQDRDGAIGDMGPGGAADPVDDGNSVSYSGGGDGSDG